MFQLDWRKSLQSLMVCAAVGVVLTATPRTHAQFGEAAGIAESMQPDYYRRDVVLISQGLKLDETQRVIVDRFFEDYQAAFDDGVERMKKRFDDMREDLQTGDKKRILKLIFKPFRDWAGEKQQLGAQFLANIEVVLTSDQVESWPSVQRRLYRERTLHRGRLSGESMNLIDVVRDLHLDKRVELQIQPVMTAYEEELDRALHRREDPLVGAKNPMLDSLEEEDLEKGQQAMRNHVQNQIGVRKVNDQYIEQVAMALPANLADQFRLAALERGYPRIYRELPVQRIFKVARELDGMDASVRQSVISLESEFLTDLAAANQQLLSALRDYEPVEAIERASDFSRRTNGEQVEPRVDPTRELFAKREELCRTYANRLHSIVTEDQFALLPGGYRWIEKPEPLSPVVTAKPPKNLDKERTTSRKVDPAVDKEE